MHLLISLVLNTLALMVTAYLLSGFDVSNWTNAVVAAIVLGFINTFIKPILMFLTLPLNILTLGLFTFIINAILLWVVSLVVSGVFINGPLSAVLAAVVLSVVSTILSMVAKDIFKST